MTGAEITHEETKALAPIGAAKLERIIRRFLARPRADAPDAPPGDHPQEARRPGRSTPAEIAFMVKGLTDGAVTEGQVAAFAMAVFFRGMTRDEAVALTEAMRDSGAVLDWSDLDGPVLDKHSTGGVGDNVSLMLAPALAACGAYRADDLRPRPRPHRRHARQARFDPRLPHPARQRPLPHGRRGGRLRHHRPDRRPRPRRQAPLRHPRRHRDGRIDAADHRLDPVEEARRRARRRWSST